MVVEHTTGTWLVLLDRDSASDSLRDLRAVGAAVLATAPPRLALVAPPSTPLRCGGSPA